MNTILVTGANGHVGCHLVRACRDAGHRSIAFVRRGSDRRGLRGVEVELREGDLLDAASVRAAMAGVDVVLHAGAVHRNWAADADAISRPAIEGTRNVLAAAGTRRIVYCSTGATIGFADAVDKPLDESASLATAKSAYIRGKIEAEKLALEAAARGQDVVVLNPSGIFGPRDYRLTPATRAVMGLLQGDPAFIGVCFTDVRDVARAHVAAIDQGRRGERYLVTGDPLAPAQVAALFADVAGIKPPTIRPPTWLLKFLVGRMEKKAAATGGDAPASRDAIDDLGKRHLVYDSGKSRRELGMSYRAARDVLVDACRWLLHVNALAPKVAAKVRAKLGDRAAPDADWG
ncbi:MAG TPA: NAD-dependent epimerase/dehydratase family protein [Polyangia bacterium]